MFKRFFLLHIAMNDEKANETNFDITTRTGIIE